jgi:Arc/MetJ-type ribon-helix-helix transcriptional regulator
MAACPKPQQVAVATTKPVDEKITINLGCVDLGQIDLLVQEGFYANRTDLIRTAIRNQIATHGESVRQAVARKTLTLGIQYFSKETSRRCRPRARSSRSACWGSPPSTPRQPRTGAGHHRIAHRARCAARRSRGEGRAARAHPLSTQPRKYP